MDSPPFLISAQVNKMCFAKTLLDSGCLSYGLVDSHFACRHCLQHIQITPRKVIGFTKSSGEFVEEVARVEIDVGGHRVRKAFLYVVLCLADYEMILGLPWFEKEEVVMSPHKGKINFQSSGIEVWNETFKQCHIDCREVSAASYNLLRKKSKIQVFAASMADIQKALTVKKHSDPKTVLPEHYHKFLDVFSRNLADRLPPLRGKGIDHQIQLENVDGKEPEVPWGPLYNMS